MFLPCPGRMIPDVGLFVGSRKVVVAFFGGLTKNFDRPERFFPDPGDLLWELNCVNMTMRLDIDRDISKIFRVRQ